MTYLDVLRDHKPVGDKVAVIGAGGIGFDVSEYLVEDHSTALDVTAWQEQWGIDVDYQQRGALKPPATTLAKREVFLLQRKESKVGGSLGKTSGWVHRSVLKQKAVQMMAGVSYVAVNDHGLVIEVKGKRKTLEVDNIIVCAGQLPMAELMEPLAAKGIKVHKIGGADVAAELDAKRAIRQGAELAAQM